MVFDPNLFFASLGSAGTQAVNAGAANIAAQGAGMAAPAAGAALYPAGAQPGMVARASDWLANPDNMMALAGAMQGLGSILSVGNPKAEAISGLAGQQLQQAAGARSLNSMKPQTGIQPPAAQPTALTAPVAGGVAPQSTVGTAPQASALTQPVAGSYLTGNPTMGSGPTAIGSVPFPKISMYMSPEAQQMAMRSYAVLQGQELDRAQVQDQQRRTGLMDREQTLKEKLSPTPEEATAERQADLAYKGALTKDIQDKPNAREDEQAHDLQVQDARFKNEMDLITRRFELDKQLEEFKIGIDRQEQQLKASKSLSEEDKLNAVVAWAKARISVLESVADPVEQEKLLSVLDTQIRRVVEDPAAKLKIKTFDEARNFVRAQNPKLTPEQADELIYQNYPQFKPVGKVDANTPRDGEGKPLEAKGTTSSAATKAPPLTASRLAEDKAAQVFAQLKAKFPRVPDATIRYAIDRSRNPKPKWEAFPKLGSTKPQPLTPEKAAEEYLRSVEGQFK